MSDRAPLSTHQAVRVREPGSRLDQVGVVLHVTRGKYLVRFATAVDGRTTQWFDLDSLLPIPGLGPDVVELLSRESMARLAQELLDSGHPQALTLLVGILAWS